MKATAWLLALLLPGLAFGQSMGEAARKEKERRKKLEQAGSKVPVLTEQTTARATGRIANDPGGAPAGEAIPADAGAAPPVADSGEAPSAQDEEAWRTRVYNARVRVDNARRYHDYLTNMVIRPGGHYTDERGRTIDDAKKEHEELLAKAKANLAGAQKALDDLLETARRQNVPPGWLR